MPEIKTDLRRVITNREFRGSEQQWGHAWQCAIPKSEGVGRILDAGCGEHIWIADDYDVVRCDNWQHYEKRSGAPQGVIDVDLEGVWPFDNKTFDGVTLVEVLEHTENPWHVLREAVRVSKSFVLLATPFVMSDLSKALFSRTGVLWGFTDDQRRKSRHITPIFPWQVEMMAEEAGWVVDETWELRASLAWAYDVTPESVHDMIRQKTVRRSAFMARLVPGKP